MNTVVQLKVDMIKNFILIEWIPPPPPLPIIGPPKNPYEVIQAQGL